MVTITQENSAGWLTEIVGNEDFCRQHKEKLGVGTGFEKDKNRVLLDDYTFRQIDKFTGVEGTWQEWSLNMLMTVTQVVANLGDSLEQIKSKAVEPLTDNMFKDVNTFDGR